MSVHGLLYNKNMDVVSMSERQQPHLDEKIQLKATHGPSKNDDETIASQGGLQLAPQQHYSRVYITENYIIQNN